MPGLPPHAAPAKPANNDRRALRAVALQFFVNGALIASFIPRLPEIRDRVGISVAGVGLLMSVAGVSGLVGSGIVGPAIGRFGTRRVMINAGAAVALSLPLIGIARTPLLLLVGLIGMLMFDVLVDVSMNMQGSWLSARRQTPVMNRLHGLWSLGTVAGGISSSLLAGAGVSLPAHLLGTAGVLLIVTIVVSRGLLTTDELPTPPDTSEAGQPSSGRVFTRLNRPLALFALAGFFSVAIESGSIEWAAFRLVDDFGAAVEFGAFGFVAVTAGMMFGRFGGDWAVARFGESRLVWASVALSGLGLTAATLVPLRPITMAGYAVAGVGIATMLPTLYDAAAQRRGRAGAGLAALTAGVRSGALTAPLLVGWLAGTDLTVGAAVAYVTLPSVAGFLVVSIGIKTARTGEPSGSTI